MNTCIMRLKIENATEVLHKVKILHSIFCRNHNFITYYDVSISPHRQVWYFTIQFQSQTINHTFSLSECFLIILWNVSLVNCRYLHICTRKNRTTMNIINIHCIVHCLLKVLVHISVSKQATLIEFLI